MSPYLPPGNADGGARDGVASVAPRGFESIVHGEAPLVNTLQAFDLHGWTEVRDTHRTQKMRVCERDEENDS